MNKMFSGCNNLTFLNFQNINITSITTMNEMFYNFQSLQYLNLYSIKEKEKLTINNTFTGSSENFTFYIKEKENTPTIFNILLNMTITERDCSTNCYDNKKRYYIPSKKLCCTKLTYKDNCYQVCQVKLML